MKAGFGDGPLSFFIKKLWRNGKEECYEEI